jgi:hypothetical protein
MFGVMGGATGAAAGGVANAEAGVVVCAGTGSIGGVIPGSGVVAPTAPVKG